MGNNGIRQPTPRAKRVGVSATATRMGVGATTLRIGTGATANRISARAAGLALALAAVAVAGCSSSDDGIATANKGTTGPGASSTSIDVDKARQAYQSCLADHGAPEGGQTDQATIQAALDACRALSPGVLDPDNQKPDVLDARRRTSECMRDLGYALWPDPQPDGQVMVPNEPKYTSQKATDDLSACARQSVGASATSSS